jgi:hypothetical protein
MPQKHTIQPECEEAVILFIRVIAMTLYINVDQEFWKHGEGRTTFVHSSRAIGSDG